MCAGFEGEEYRRDHSTWFSAWRKPPIGAAGRSVCVLIEQEGELLCHLEMPGAIPAKQEA